jgi:DNA-binding beta-propeller fold protein YncE
MRRAARLMTIGLLCVLVLGGIRAADAAATTGDLTQKPGLAGCWSAGGSCSPGTGLAGARSVTVSPDGRSAYAASQGRSAVSVFDRAADGTLTQKPGTAGCISETGAGPCVDGMALDSARSVTVSPDGRSAYVASGSIVRWRCSIAPRTAR